MCGIAGIYAYHYAANGVDRNELERIRDHMTMRGPDGDGEWYSADGRVGFGHRRLSIIDLSERGTQPMKSHDGNLVVNFNGEIYNYRALQTELERKGHVFRSSCDTEVLLALYAEYGCEMVHHLQGMFAFALWDGVAQQLILARDPYGIKPLYYADDGQTVRFASQVKAILKGGKISRDSDPAGWAGFYLFGNVPEPFTIYRSVRSVPAGTLIKIDRLGVNAPTRYHSIAASYCDGMKDQIVAKTGDDLQDYIRQALLESVRRHLVADVPIGAFLSAGIDSSSLVGLMRDAGQDDIQTVTLSFEEFRNTIDDEAPLAEKIAKLYGARHTTRVVTVDEFQTDIPRIFDAMDQPTIDGINTWFISKAAHELGVKVAISGLGGDELFGGYSSFRDIPHWLNVFGLPSHIPFLGRAFRQSLRAFQRLRGVGNPKAASILEFGGSVPGAYLLRRGLFMPWELENIMGEDLAREGLRRLRPLEHIGEALTPDPRNSFAQVSTLESSIYMRNQLLRDTDWASMAHSVEVRVPFVDVELLRSTSRVFTQFPASKVNTKDLIATSPRTNLPKEITVRSKTGFLTPMSAWLESAKFGKAAAKTRQTTRSHWSRRWAIEVASAAN